MTAARAGITDPLHHMYYIYIIHAYVYSLEDFIKCKSSRHSIQDLIFIIRCKILVLSEAKMRKHNKIIHWKKKLFMTKNNCLELRVFVNQKNFTSKIWFLDSSISIWIRSRLSCGKNVFFAFKKYFGLRTFVMRVLSTKISSLI